jgi:hypothetical protein
MTDFISLHQMNMSVTYTTPAAIFVTTERLHSQPVVYLLCIMIFATIYATWQITRRGDKRFKEEKYMLFVIVLVEFLYGVSFIISFRQPTSEICTIKHSLPKLGLFILQM